MDRRLALLFALIYSAHANPCEGLDRAVLPHETSCKRFIVCVGGKPVEFTCRDNRYFDVLSQQCLPKEKAVCNSRSKIIGDETQQMDEDNVPCPILPDPNGIICNETTGQYRLSDPENCGYYYLCYNGFVIHERCPGNFEFSASLRVCTFPNIAECEIAEEEQNGGVTIHFKDDTSKISSNSSFVIATPTDERDNIFCRDTDNHYAMPDPNSCENYYVCSYGKLALMQCPQNYAFSPTVLKCLPENETTCRHTISDPILIDSEPTSLPTTSIYIESSATSTTPATTAEVHPSTPKRPHSITCDALIMQYLIPDEYDCRYYYICSYGKIIHLQCPNNFKFDSIKMACVSPDKAHCTDNAITTLTATTTTTELPIPKTTTTDAPVTTSTEESNRPDTTTTVVLTTLPITTVSDVPATPTFKTTTEIPTSSLVTSASEVPTTITEAPITPPAITTSEVLTTTSETTTTTKPLHRVTCDIPYKRYRVPDELNCKYYYVCYYGKLFHLLCVPDFEFDSIKMQCVPAGTANCAGKTTTTIPPITTTTQVPTTLPVSTTNEIHTTPPFTTTEEPATPPFTITTEVSTTPAVTTSTEISTTIPVTTTTEMTITPFFTTTTEILTSLSDTTVTEKTTIEPVTPTTELLTTTTEDPSTLPASNIPDDRKFTTTTEVATSSATTKRPHPLKCENSDKQYLVPDEEDCKYYYVCTFGVMIHMKCADEYEFNSEELKCMPPGEANYAGTTTTTTATTTSLVDEGSLSIPSTNPELPESIIPLCQRILASVDNSSRRIEPPRITCDHPEKQYITPDPEDVGYYYICAYGVANHMKCADSYEFDTDRLECTPPKPNTTAIEKVTSSTTAAPRNVIDSIITLFSRAVKCDLTKEYYRIPDPQNCRYYYLCYYGVPIHEKCPYKFEFSPTIKECLAPSLARCEVPNLEPGVPTESTKHSISTRDESGVCHETYYLYKVVADPADCSHYYICLIGMPIRTKCVDDLQFDPKLLQCVPQSQSTCQSKSNGVKSHLL